MGKLVLGVNDLATARPELCLEWHYDLNGDQRPEMIALGSHSKVWWQCSQYGHTYFSTVLSRSRGSGCPYCSNQRLLPGFNDLMTTHPEIARELSTSKNKLSASEVFAGSEKKLWWQCENFPHTYESIVKDKVKKRTGCPYCTGNRVLSGFNDILTTDPNIAIEFSISENKLLTAQEISIGSAKKVWWECPEYKHLYQASPTERKRGQGCVYCAGKKVLRGFNDLHTTHPEIAKEFSDLRNKDFSVYSLSMGMTQKIWWKCSKHGHHYQSRVYNRVYGQGCPYCSGNRVLSDFNDLLTTHPDLSREFLIAENLPFTPKTVSAGSHTKIWWKCLQGDHIWKVAVKDRTSGNGCAKCSESQTSKIQQAFHKALAIKIPDLQCDTRIPVPLKSKKSMSVDMISIEANVIIEYDGRYYHSGERSGEGLQYHLDHDSAKTQALLNAGYRVVRIRENSLQHLDMTHEWLMQISYKNGDLINSVVNEICEFIEEMLNG